MFLRDAVAKRYVWKRLAIAVGTAVSGGPPHRSVREAFPQSR